MELLLWLRNSVIDFLFPRSELSLKLQGLSPESLLATLPHSNFDGGQETLALFDYRHPLIKEIIWEVKYNGNRQLADKLGAILFDVIIDELSERHVLEKYGDATLIPMPISIKRRLERGWNQTELIAKAIKARDTANHFMYLPHALTKIRHTESQTRTNTKRERIENLKDSMQVADPSLIKGKFVVIVDDVLTTGSTFNEACRALKEAGAKRILCIAVCH